MKGERYHNDEAILQDVKQGNETALRILVDRYRPQMLIEAYFLIKNKEEAEDIIQNVFMRFWLLRKNIDYKTSLGPYLLRAIRNESLISIAKHKVLEKRQRLFTYLQDSAIDIDPVENKELGKIIMETIDMLPKAARHTFKMLYLESKSHKVIASEQNISIQAVKNNISRGLKMLRQKLHPLK